MPYILAIGGAIGFLAAFALTVEKLALLKDSTYTPTCSINPILSCGSVMNTPQGEAFGVPNPLIGIGGFAIVTTIGVAHLGGVRFPRWFWLGLQAGTVFGIVFVHWLIAQSLYTIGALCPYCMVVWAVMILIFWYTTLHTAQHYLSLPPSIKKVTNKLAQYHTVVVTVWYLAIAGLILQAFWSYWSTLL
ncbi:vitamin K epoxide reductase family protein [Allosaccharopolyspora coralli]|uniref:vitamin K epoxide reductase family protein n=1 Tax=Allosaccharopolyspora coralli TaxID=2665642 RepID=UPI002B417E65|nr:vitamin K epoxide reductase family protein [Allosaccharopolyspora coralli]